jgi:hypothetical protein
MQRRHSWDLVTWTMLLAAAVWLAAAELRGAVEAQTPPPKVLVLVPYGEPNNADPHADGETQTLEADLKIAGIAVKTVSPIDHLRAVSEASNLCAANAAAGLLIAEGRYEQTEHTSMIPILPVQMSSFPAHVELRLDEIDCRGVVVWSAHATGDDSTAGANFGVGATAGNVGSVIDVDFRNATAVVVTALAKAPPPSPEPSNTVAPAAPTPNSAVYLVVPFEQPYLADPRAPDITHSLAAKLRNRGLTVKVGAPIDRLTAVSGAGALCLQNGVTEIVVPAVRLEQAKRSHAELRLDMLDCSGNVQSSAVSQADIRLAYSGKALIEVAEDAMDPALDQLLGPAK